MLFAIEPGECFPADVGDVERTMDSEKYIGVSRAREHHEETRSIIATSAARVPLTGGAQILSTISS